MAKAEPIQTVLEPGYGIKARVIADVSDMPEKDWLALRRHYLGASEVSAVLGINPYKSCFGVYVDKAEGSTFEGNIHTEFGNWMEPHIRAEFPKRFLKDEGTEIKVSAYPYMLQHPEHDCLSVNLDGIVEHPEYGVGVIEIKTAGEMQWKQWQEDELPDMYFCQIQQELSITGLSYAYVVALVGKRLLWKYVARDDEFIEIMTPQLLEFWNDFVFPKQAPAPIGLDDDTDILKKLYEKENSGKCVELHDHQSDYDRYKELAAEIKALNMEQEAIKQKFMQALGDAELGFVGNKKVTWKTTHRKGYTVEPTSYRALRVY
jgi:putative phage-type endonuclease